jgi:hypothetical protein
METDMTHRKRRFVLAATLAAAAGALLLGSQKASAQTSVLTLSDTQLNPTTWQYNLTLGDTASSTTNIGTLWYAWIPGQDYLTTKPASANITSPAGWTLSAVTGGSTGDGYGIRWVSTAAGDQITPGGSLSGFSFESSDPPSTVFGDSSFYPTTPTSTFFTYSGNAPFSGTAVESVGTAVPEPTSVALLAPAALMLCRRTKRTKA